MTTNIEYALMAGASYVSNRDKINRFPIPEGWSPTKYENSLKTKGVSLDLISQVNRTKPESRYRLSF